MSLFLPRVLVAIVIAVPAPKSSPALAFKALVDEAWEFRLREDPLMATRVGDGRYDDRLPAVAPADFDRRVAYWKDALERLGRIDRAALPERDRVSYDILKLDIEDKLAELDFRTWRMTLNAEWGFHSEFARLPATSPFVTTRDYQNYIARLQAFPAYARQQTANMREGIESGFLQPRVILEGFEGTITSHIVSDVSRSAFWAPFASFPATVPEADRERLRSAGRAAIETSVIPTYRAFLDFMTREYIPNARATVGASELPRGREYYGYLVRHYTTLGLTPDQIHETGLAARGESAL